MATILLALALMQAPMGGGPALPPASSQHVIASGMATRYAPGLMEEVASNRLRMGHVKPCPTCVGYVALVDCSQIGKRVYLRSPFGIIGPVMSVDCAAPADLPTIRERRIVAEVSFEQGLAWQMAGPIPVEVLEEVKP